MKILIITQNFYPEIGSAANRAKNIYFVLKEKGYEVNILTTEPNYPNRNLYSDEAFWDEDIPEDEIMRVQLKTRKYTSSMFKRLIYHLETMLKLIFYNFKLKKDYDVVFATLPSIFIGIAGVVAKMRQKATLILDIRDLWPETLVGLKRFHNKLALKMAYSLESFLYRRADNIIVNSEGFIPYMLSKKVPRAKISFIPNSLTESELEGYLSQKEQRLDSDEITVLYAGNIGLAQDLDTLIDIAKKLSHNPKIKFDVIGYGFLLKDFKQKIMDLGLNNIEISQALSRKATLMRIAAADMVYVTLKDSDVFKTVLPGKVIDYMGLSKPIVANVAGYPAYTIWKANCGIVVSEANNVDELCRFISELAISDDLRYQLGENGRKYAKMKFNWAVNLGILVEILEKKELRENVKRKADIREEGTAI